MNMKHIEEQFLKNDVVEVNLPNASTLVLSKSGLTKGARVRIFRNMSMVPDHESTIEGDFINNLSSTIESYLKRGGLI